MARGWQCDECGKWTRGEPPYQGHFIVGDPKVLGDYHCIVEVVYHAAEGERHYARHLCETCAAKHGGPKLKEWIDAQVAGPAEE